MPVRPSALALVCLLAACARPPARSGTVEEGRPIVGGVLDEGDRPVVLIVAYSTRGAATESWLCTGTLVAPSTVLTAAHCTDIGADAFEAEVLFTTTWDMDSYGVACTSPGCEAVEVVEQLPHPNAASSEISAGFDVALLHLATPVTDTPWIPLSDAPMGPDLVLASGRHVGFGLPGPDAPPNGAKAQALILIQEIQARTFRSDGYGRSTCFGDSGGPVLLATGGLPFERVVGVVSYGDTRCTTGWSVRVDALHDFVASTMAGWEPAPACALDGYCLAAGCAAPDPDCRAFLEPCTGDAACGEGVCWADPQHRGAYCSRACASAAECDGLACGAAGRCELPQAPTVERGQPCSPTDFCAGFGACEGETATDLRCRTPCDAAAAVSGCPSPVQSCVLGAGGSAYCKDPAPPPPPAKGDEGGCGTGAGAWALLSLAGLAMLRRRSA